MPPLLMCHIRKIVRYVLMMSGLHLAAFTIMSHWDSVTSSEQVPQVTGLKNVNCE